MKTWFMIFCVALVTACQPKTEVLDHERYEGPSVAMKNINVLITDSTIVKLRLIAATQHQLNNGDRDFPNGIYIEFFNKAGNITSTLKANTGFYFSEEDYYQAKGNVLMKSLESGDDLSSELLYWTPKEERIHTDQFVTIATGDEVLTGEGLEANQDFSEYTITKPSGTMTLVKGVKPKAPKKEEEDFDPDLIFEEDTIILEQATEVIEE